MFSLKAAIIILIGVMLGLEGFFFIIPVKSAPAVSTTTTTASQPLVSFTGTVTSFSKPPPAGQIGEDRGTNQIRFKQNAIQFFRSTGGNITRRSSENFSSSRSRKYRMGEIPR